MFLVVIVVALILWPESISCKCSRGEPSCKIMRTHGMKSADCYKLDLHQIPKCLTADAEVIDLTYNRIREITASDLKRYKNLKFLYLGENMITKIDPEAFADKTQLETLDLTYNGFSRPLPEVIFHLPSLKNLYLSQNQNINIVEILENSAPITSPLVRLDISYNNYEELQRLPKLGIIQTMNTYNVSGMELVLSTADTAGLCNLQNFVTDNVTAHFEDPCDCWHITSWLKLRLVKFTPFECGVTQEECPYELPPEDEELFDVCKKHHAEMIYQNKLNKTLIIASVVVIVLFAVLLIIIYRWRKSKRRRNVRGFSVKEFNHI